MSLSFCIPMVTAVLFFTYCNSMGLANWPLHLLVAFGGSVFIGVSVGIMQYASDKLLDRI